MYHILNNMSRADFVLDSDFTKKLSEKKENFGFNGLGRLVYYRTYSRLKPDGKKECWWETVQRVVEGAYTIQKKHITSLGLAWNESQGQRLAQEMAERMFDMKFLPPGRGLWAMGSKITKEKGLFASLSNCAFVSTINIDKEPTKPFEFLMDMSMLGIGVGFDSQGAGKFTIKKPLVEEMKFLIPDTREGWVQSLKVLLESYFLGKNKVVMDYSSVRPAGEPLKVFGGISSGPGPLKEMHEDITKVLDNNVDKPISIRVINDLMNLIGKCVVSGNIRRSSEISFGPPDSEEFINLKNYTLNPERSAYGWSANNSIYGVIGMDYDSVAKRIADNGEPGLVWLENMRAYSRMGSEVDWKDLRLWVVIHASLVIPIFTTEGFKSAIDLVGKQFTAIINGKECPSTDKGFWCTGQKDLFKITLKNGQTVRATDNHKFLTDGGKWEEVKNLKPGTKMVIPDNTGKFTWSGPGTYNEGYFIGQLIGDGTFMVNRQEENLPIVALWTSKSYTNPRIINHMPLSKIGLNHYHIVAISEDSTLRKIQNHILNMS